MISKSGITKRNKGRTFSIAAPEAQLVQLAGEFTGWHDQPITMRRQSTGVWQATVELEPGEHHYRFLVDGEWRDDPECTLRVPNPYGSENMVRRLE